MFLANMYVVGMILLLCINYYLQGLQLQTNTTVFSCFALGGIIILPLGIIVLSWESKWEKYEDEDKGYFIWLFLLIIMLWLSYKTLGNTSYMKVLSMFSSIYLLSIWYLQNKLNHKSTIPLTKTEITKLDYSKSICVMCGLQLFIVIFYWNFVKIYACTLMMGVFSVICISILEVLLIISNRSTVLAKRKVVSLALANVGMLAVMCMYTYFEKNSLGYGWLSARENYTNSFVHCVANILLVILQVPLWNYANSLDDLEKK